MAVVDPVGLNANWSLKVRPSGGLFIAGYMKLVTTWCSSDREIIEVTEIGRYSDGFDGNFTLATGVISAFFHWYIIESDNIM